MIYTDRMATFEDASHNFKIYRIVRLLHNLRVVSDTELILHEETIWNTLPVGLDIDWYHYRIHGGPSNEIYQF